MNSRILTVSKQYRYSASKRAYVEVAFFTLKGSWLKKQGFEVGCKVEVSCLGYGELNIKLIQTK